MGGILSSLNKSYTGLKTSQVMVDVSGHNISNANNEHYSRQRVVTSASAPIRHPSYNLGQGVEITTIERIHNEFVFSRYKKASQEKEFTGTQKHALMEASAYYPEIDNVGIYNDLQNYFNSWKDLANKAGDPAQKLALAQLTQTLSANIKDTRYRLSSLQEKLNDELKISVEEINRLGQQIANINKQISINENNTTSTKANDLRDKRDELEMKFNELAEITVFKGGLKKHTQTNNLTADFSETYTLNLSGKTLVDGHSFHPLVLDSSQNSNGFYSVFYVGQDWKKSDITTEIKGGKVGAFIDLSYSDDQKISCDQSLGKLQNYIDDLDTFSRGFIEATNNIYAQSSVDSITGDVLNIKPTDPLLKSDYNLKEGSFDVVMYNSLGEEMGRKNVKIDPLSTMKSVIDRINDNSDSNSDGNNTNDIDDSFVAIYNEVAKTFQIMPKNPSEGFTVSIQDNGSNFGGALGLNRFLDGDSGKNISLSQEFLDDPTLIRAYREPVDGNFIVANMIQQMQYEKVDFFEKDGNVNESKVAEYFKMISARVATDTEQVVTLNDTKTSVYNSIRLEYSSISEVNIDEELVNIMRFQAGYGANAKVVTTIDQMINTLLGMKQ